MNTRYKSLLFFLLGSWLTTAAIAQDITENSFYVDASGLSWLRLEHTASLSKEAVQAELGADGTLSGFRYATIDEFLDLMSEFSVLESISGDGDNFVNAMNAIDALGMNVYRFKQEGIETTETREAIAWLEGDVYASIYAWRVALQGFPVDLYESGYDILYDNVPAYSEIAHFLVYEQTAAEPTTINLLETIAEKLDMGKIAGTGAGASADKRLSALINMVITATALIDDGNIEEGCQQLAAVYKKCDGESRPPDFIAGEGAEQVAGLILELIEFYGCGL